MMTSSGLNLATLTQKVEDDFFWCNDKIGMVVPFLTNWFQSNLSLLYTSKIKFQAHQILDMPIHD